MNNNLSWTEVVLKVLKIKGGGYFTMIATANVDNETSLKNLYYSSVNISMPIIMIKLEISNAYLKLLFVLCSDVDNILS